MAEQPTSPARKVVNRPRVVNRLVRFYDAPRYLEVGVCAARTFDRVQADTKVAVDPLFQFDHEDPERRIPGVEYHQITSDDYFGSVVDPDRQFDVIFLDGLHTLEQTLRDLTNALHHLQPRGVIVIDDVRPPTYLASVPDRARFFEIRRALGTSENAWMGDVYRVVLVIESFFQQLTYRTIANNHGQTVVWRARRPSVADRRVAAVGDWSFEDLLLHPDILRPAPFGQILRELREDLGLEPRPSAEGSG